MKKKVLASLISSLLVICMLGTSVFAATPVLTEDFEIEPIDGLYVSMPEIRVYSENLMTNTGTFEDAETYDKNMGVSGGGKACDGTVAHSGSSSLKLTPSSGTISVQPYALPSKLDAGVYEVEAYVKSDNPYIATAGINANVGGSFLSAANGNLVGGVADNGNVVGAITLDSEWQRVVGRFVFTKSPVGMTASSGKVFADDGQQFAFNIGIDKGNAADTSAPIYFDDVKVRKVLNAVPSTVTRQAGMPTYPIDALSGKQKAQVIIDVKNQTNEAQDLTLITAYYNEDGSLEQVLNVYKIESKVPVSDAIQHIESNTFDIPTIADGGEIKTFVWDGTSSLFPYTDQADSSFTTSHIFKEGTSAEAQAFKSKPLPGSDNVFSYDQFTSATSGTTAHYGNQMYTGAAKSGVRSLYISGQADARSDTSATASGVNFKVEPNHKYKVEFYVMRSTAQAIAFRISGASQYGNIRGGATVPVQEWSAEGVTAYTSVSGFTTIADGKVTTTDKVRPLAKHHVSPTDGSKGWTKVTCTFTTPPATALANTYKESSSADYGERLYWDVFGYGDYAYMSVSFVPNSYICAMSGSKTAQGAWVDDITVTDITE